MNYKHALIIIGIICLLANFETVPAFAQAGFDDEYLKKAMRASMPAGASCRVNEMGPRCSYTIVEPLPPNAVRVVGRVEIFKQENVFMHVKYQQLTEKLNPLFKILSVFASKFGFSEQEAEGCVMHVIKEPTTLVEIKNRNYTLFCVLRRQGNDNRLEGELRANTDF